MVKHSIGHIWRMVEMIDVKWKADALKLALDHNTLHRCHNFPAGLWQATRGTHICETCRLILNDLGIWGASQ